MKQHTPRKVTRALMAASLLLSVLAPATAEAVDPKSASCLSGTPAFSIPETRVISQVTYTLWPESMCPADPTLDSTCADPSVQLPDERDSTSYGGSQTPARGLEFFYDFDILDDHLYMAYNSGFQIWDISGANAKNPAFLSGKDGFFGEFFEFEGVFTHNFQLIWDIAALNSVDPGAAAGEVLVAVGAGDPVGLTIWDVTSKTDPTQVYQDPELSGFQVEAAIINGRAYAFFATPAGVYVYDMTRARDLGACVESGGALCGGANPVRRGVLDQVDCNPGAAGDQQCAKYLSLLETEVPNEFGPPETRHYLSFSDANIGTPLGLEVREITDPANAGSTPVLDGLTLSASAGLVFANELFEVDDRYYLGVVNVDDLEIYDLTPCVTEGPGDPGCGFGNRRISFPTSLTQTAFMQYSEGNGTPFLYKGVQNICTQPPTFGGNDVEFLLDLSEIATAATEEDRAKRILGDEYADPTNGRRINYWTTNYDQSEAGYSAFSPIAGVFNGEYFYRSGQTTFEVHRLRGPVQPSLKISVDSPDRWLSSTEPQLDEWVQLGIGCEPEGNFVDSNWMWSADNADGTPVSDPAPLLDNATIKNPQVLAELCAGDTYPAAVCPGRTIEVDATADCDETPLVAPTVSLSLDDPRPFVTAVEVDEGASGAAPYSICQQLTFRASEAIGGKSDGRTFEWRVTPLTGGVARLCPGDPQLSCDETTLTWVTSGADLGLIFADGFESGDISRWESAKNATATKGEAATHDVTLSLWNPHLPAEDRFERATQVTLGLLPALDLDPSVYTFTGPGADGSYDFTALATGATMFHWEFEQAPGLPGNDPACGPGETGACCRLVTPCQVVETVIDEVNYTWPQDNSSGELEVGVEISNCEPGAGVLSATRADDFEVVVPDPPEITSFLLVQDANCECNIQFAPGECHCTLTGPTVTANVTVGYTGTCDSLEINWGDGDVDSGLACDEASYSHPYDELGSYELTAEACLGTLCDTQVRFTIPSVRLDIEE